MHAKQFDVPVKSAGVEAVEMLVARMRDDKVEVPLVRDVAVAYAHQVDAIAHKLTEKELASMVLLGVVINRRASRLVPVLRPDQVDAWLAGTLSRPQTSSTGDRPS